LKTAADLVKRTIRRAKKSSFDREAFDWPSNRHSPGWWHLWPNQHARPHAIVGPHLSSWRNLPFADGQRPAKLRKNPNWRNRGATVDTHHLPRYAVNWLIQSTLLIAGGENDSQGTDHGAAAPVFIACKRSAGGLVGSTPNLSDLDDGDVKMSIDLRSIYASLLDDWLGVNSSAVLGKPFAKTKVLST
jgi:hypothetical protein